MHCLAVGIRIPLRLYAAHLANEWGLFGVNTYLWELQTLGLLGARLAEAAPGLNFSRMLLCWKPRLRALWNLFSEVLRLWRPLLERASCSLGHCRYGTINGAFNRECFYSDLNLSPF